MAVKYMNISPDELLWMFAKLREKQSASWESDRTDAMETECRKMIERLIPDVEQQRDLVDQVGVISYEAGNDGFIYGFRAALQMMDTMETIRDKKCLDELRSF